MWQPAIYLMLKLEVFVTMHFCLPAHFSKIRKLKEEMSMLTGQNKVN